MCFPLERRAYFCKHMKTKCIRAKKLSKMHFANDIFNARTYQDLSPTIILHFARQPLVFFENHKIRWVVLLGRPGGMRGAAGGDMRGSEICKMRSDDVAFALGLTCHLLAMRQGRRIQSLRAFRRARPRPKNILFWSISGYVAVSEVLVRSLRIERINQDSIL